MHLKRSELEFKVAYNKIWLKIFFHNSTGRVYFTENDNPLYINEPQKFSILGFITEKFRISDFYEFLLEKNPEVEGYNNWKQSIFPTKANETITTDLGYTCETSDDCSCSWTQNYWKGLILSSLYDLTFIDGSVDQCCWRFAIGAKKGYEQNVGFPGPAGGTAGSGLAREQVYLWLRCTESMMKELLTFYTTSLTNQINLVLFAYIFLINKVE